MPNFHVAPNNKVSATRSETRFDALCVVEGGRYWCPVISSG